MPTLNLEPILYSLIALQNPTFASCMQYVFFLKSKASRKGERRARLPGSRKPLKPKLRQLETLNEQSVVALVGMQIGGGVVSDSDLSWA